MTAAAFIDGGVAQVLPYAASITIDTSTYKATVVGALTGNINVQWLIRGSQRDGTLTVSQDATGGRLVTFTPPLGWRIMRGTLSADINAQSSALSTTTYQYSMLVIGGVNTILINKVGLTEVTLADILGSSLVLDLNADKGITLGSTIEVAQWADQSGQGNHYTQATAGTRPSYYANQLDGHGGVFFNYNDRVAGEKGMYLAANFVGMPSGARPYAYVIVASGGYYNGGIFGTAPTGTLGVWGLEQVYFALQGPNISVGWAPSGYYLYTYRYDTDLTRLDANNANIATAAAATLPSAMLACGLGYYYGVADAQSTWISRLIFANAPPSATQHAQVIAYLRGQYPSIAIAVP